MLRRHFITAILIAICSVFLISPAPVSAEDSVEESSVNERRPALEITPVTKRVALNANETHDSTLNVTNIGSNNISIRIYAKPFSTRSDSEVQDYETDTNYTQISRWITIKSENGAYETEVIYTLSANETKAIEYKINVPEDVPGGGQYAVLFVEAIPDGDAEDNIQTISRVGMTIYATMPGEPKRSVHIGNTSIDAFILNGGVSTQTRINNDGNIDFQASIQLNVYSLFGKQLYSNNVVSAILPESSKTIYAGWEEAPKFGIYRIEYSISALDVYTTGSRYILVMTSTTLIVAIALTIAAILSMTYLIKRRSNKSKNAPDIRIG
ncbi:hypothetical protein IK146_01465 [Candidatus Saccharibacteria bacterium]|nr:hypothetical protein [Candidatus Saccharibacteria bacterium]